MLLSHRKNGLTSLNKEVRVFKEAGQDKAGRSNFPHFAIRAASGENADSAENAEFLCFHTKNEGF